jgi:hypothetical protein
MTYEEMRMAEPLLEAPGARNVRSTGTVRKSGARVVAAEEVVMKLVAIRGLRIMTKLAVVCALAAELLLVGCRPRPLALPGREDDPRELPGREPNDTRAGVQDNVVTVKTVAGKEPPATLIAEDRSRCAVSERRYRETTVGERLLCAWRTGSRAP